MPKKLFKILEVIGVLVIILIGFVLFPKISIILKVIYKILLPFVIAFLVAFLLEPVIEFLEKKHIKRKIAIYIIVIFFMIIFFVLFKYLIPLMIKEIKLLFVALPSYIDKIKEIIDNINGKLNGSYIIDYSKIEVFLQEKINTFLTKFSVKIQENFSYMLQVLITPVLVVYFMFYYKNIENYIREKIKNDESNLIKEALSKIKIIVRQYFKGVLIVMLILTAISTVCFWYLGLDFSLILGLIIGITDIIPYIGPYIGGGIVIAFTLASIPTKVLFVLICIVTLQLLESYFLVPKIQSKNLETNPIIVLLSVAIFGEILGIIGMIIAVPMIKILQILANLGITYKKYKKSR